MIMAIERGTSSLARSPGPVAGDSSLATASDSTFVTDLEV